MAGSADPTNEEVLENLQYNVGRISVAQREIIRRLEENMPGKIAFINERLGYVEGAGICLPAAYAVAPAVLSEDYLNSILCGVAVSTSANGPGTFKNVAKVEVYSVQGPAKTGTQVQDAFDRAAIAIGILLKYLTGCVDAGGRRVWRLLEPTGHELSLPNGWNENYSGSTATFRLVQDSSCNCWDEAGEA